MSATQTPETVEQVAAQDLENARSEAERYKAALIEMQAHTALLYQRAAREQFNTLATGLDLLARIAEEALG